MLNGVTDSREVRRAKAAAGPSQSSGAATHRGSTQNLDAIINARVQEAIALRDSYIQSCMTSQQQAMANYFTNLFQQQMPTGVSLQPPPLEPMVPWTVPPPSNAQVWDLLYFISYNHSISSKTISYTLITSISSFILHRPLLVHLAIRRAGHSTHLSRGYWMSLRTWTVAGRTRTIRMCKCLYDDYVCVGTLTDIPSWWLCDEHYLYDCVGW